VIIQAQTGPWADNKSNSPKLSNHEPSLILK